MRPLPARKVAWGIRVAAEGQGTARQLLPPLPSRVQAGALRGESPALHRGSHATKEGTGRRAHRVSRRVSTGASLRRLRRDRSRGARVRSPSRQGIWHRNRISRPRMEKRARRDCQVRGGLCKLSSSPHCRTRRLRSRGG